MLKPERLKEIQEYANSLIDGDRTHEGRTLQELLAAYANERKHAAQLEEAINVVLPAKGNPPTWLATPPERAVLDAAKEIPDDWCWWVLGSSQARKGLAPFAAALLTLRGAPLKAGPPPAQEESYGGPDHAVFGVKGEPIRNVVTVGDPLGACGGGGGSGAGQTVSVERRAPVQGEGTIPRLRGYKPPGTIAWLEHERAWRSYAERFGKEQPAERIAERGGFGWLELCELLGREPETWVPRF